MMTTVTPLGMMMTSAPYSESSPGQEPGQFEPEELLACLADLSARQILAGMDEAAGTVALLSTSLLEASRTISVMQQDKPASEQAEQLQILSQQVMTAFSSLQFVDRLQQRLSNVSGNLGDLARAVTRPMDDAEHCQELIAQLRDRYTMEAERKMLDEALRTLRAK